MPLDDLEPGAPQEDARLLGAILRNVVDGIITITAEGIITTFNPAAEQIFGYSAEETVGKDVSMLMTDRDRDHHGEYLHRLQASGREPEIGRGRELVGLRNDGTSIQLELAVSEIDDAEGARYVGIVRDVSDRLAAERELGLNHTMLSAISAVQSEFIIDGDPRRAFDALLQQFLHLSGSEYGFIGEVLIADGGTRYLKTHAITNIAWDAQTHEFFEQNAPQGLEFGNLQTLFGEVITTERPVVANNPASDPRAGGLPPGHPSLDAFLGIPFFMGTRMVGMVGIANRPGGYGDGVVELLRPLTQTCANLVGAIDAKREREAAEEALKDANDQLNATVDAIRIQNEQMRLLSQLEDLLQTCESRDEAARVVSHMAEQMFSGWDGALYILDPHHHLLEPVTAWGGAGTAPELSSRDCIAMRRSRRHISARAAGPLDCSHVDIHGRVGICVPLVGKSEAFGLFHLATDVGRAELEDLRAAEELASTAARRIAVTLANLRLSESLRDQSVRDPLTELFNRRYMLETLGRELRRGERARTAELSLVSARHRPLQVGERHVRPCGGRPPADRGRRDSAVGDPPDGCCVPDGWRGVRDRAARLRLDRCRQAG